MTRFVVRLVLRGEAPSIAVLDAALSHASYSSRSGMRTEVHEAADAIVHAFAEIRSAAGLTGSLSAVSTAMASATDHRSDGDRS